MRLLFVTPLYAPYVGGATAFVSAMARRFVDRGDLVTVLTANAMASEQLWKRPVVSPGLRERETVSGVEVERLQLGYVWPEPYAFAALRRLGHVPSLSSLPAAMEHRLLVALSRWMPRLPGLSSALDRLIPQADLVHIVESSWDGLFVRAAVAALRHAKPVVATPLMHLGDARIAAHFQMAHQVRAYRSASAVIALSNRERDAYERLGVDRARLHSLAMGVDVPPAGLLRPEQGIVFRRERGISGPLVAFLGANTYDKGAFTLALAVAGLNATGTPVNVVFAGPQSETLTAFVAAQPAEVQTALKGRLRILGVGDESTKHALLAACDLLALPSRVDSFGIVLLEAWLHAKPVIGATAGGIPELARDGETGLLVPFGEPSALERAIAQLLEDPDLASRLGSEGRDRVLRRYTWDTTFVGLQRIYGLATMAGTA